MQQTIFGMLLGVLLVLTVYVGFEIEEKYSVMNSSDYVAPTEFITDIDGIKYRK